MLAAKCVIFVFLTLNSGPTGHNHVIIYCFEALSSLNSTGEVLSGSLFLELLNLNPDRVRHIVVSSNGVQHLGQAKLLQESSHLLVFLRHLREFALNDALKNILEFILKDTHCRWHDVTQFIIEVRLSVDLISHRHQIDEVLRIKGRHIAEINFGLIVNLLVVIDSLGEDTLSLRELRGKVGQIGAATSFSKGLSLGVVLHAESHIRNSLVHALTFFRSFRILEVSKLPVGHGLEVARMVTEHIRKLAVVEAAQVRVDLVSIKGFLEVDGDLSGDLGQHSWVHAGVRGLLEEEVLGLSQTQVTVLGECLLVKVASVGLRWELSGHIEKLLKDPSCLTEKRAGHLDAITGQLHVTSTSAQAYGKVVQAGQGCEKG